MKLETTTITNPLFYFLAGALLPTIAYVFLLRNNKEHEKIEFEDEYEDDDDDDDGDTNGDTGSAGAGFIDPIDKTNRVDPSKWGITDAPYKMVLCVNTSLGMQKGKIMAQCCHAAVGCYKLAQKKCPSGLKTWEMTGCAKIAVKCPSEEEMVNQIYRKAKQAGIPCYLVEDAGRTQIAAGSRTVLGLGPAPVKAFEDITSHLKLM